jgi:dTDP-4-dehydrorhamnose 3,5-epimerase
MRIRCHLARGPNGVNITRTRIPDVQIIEPRVFEDERGWFVEDFQDSRFESHGLPVRFRQDNWSRSKRGVLRGLHYQLDRPQGKLITCVTGHVFDVALDIRRGSPTFGKWVGVELQGDKPRQLWIPPGFAHGFCVLSASADVMYKCTDVYVPEDERGVLWCDPKLRIEWPITEPIVSKRDRANRPLDECMDDLPGYVGSPR